MELEQLRRPRYKQSTKWSDRSNRLSSGISGSNNKDGNEHGDFKFSKSWLIRLRMALEHKIADMPYKLMILCSYVLDKMI